MEKKNGVVETYYESDQIESRTNYKAGKLDGLREVWFENGKLLARANYKNGELHGLYEIWHKNGQIELRVHFKDDKPNGLHEIWDENGQLKSRVTYKDGVAVEQENDRNVSEEELLRLERENLALKIMILRDKQIAREITYEESLKQLDRLIEEYDKTK